MLYDRAGAVLGNSAAPTYLKAFCNTTLTGSSLGHIFTLALAFSKEFSLHASVLIKIDTE